MGCSKRGILRMPFLASQTWAPLPPVQARNEPLRVFIGARWQLYKPVCPGQGRKVARPVGGGGHGPGTAPVIDLDSDRHEKRQLGAIRYFTPEGHLLGRQRVAAHG